MRLRPFALCLALAVSSAAQAQPRNYGERELALLPGWCKYTQDFRDKVPGGNNPAEYQRLMTITNGAFQHMHHHCWGLIDQNNALLRTRDPKKAAYLLRQSVGEFDYVLRNTPPDFIMRPEVLMKRADSLIRLGRGPEGEADLQRALSQKPDYWPAWLALADYYDAKVGDKAKAAYTLEQGIAAAPNAPTLRERLAELKSGVRR